MNKDPVAKKKKKKECCCNEKKKVGMNVKFEKKETFIGPWHMWYNKNVVCGTRCTKHNRRENNVEGGQ